MKILVSDAGQYWTIQEPIYLEKLLQTWYVIWFLLVVTYCYTADVVVICELVRVFSVHR